MSTSPCIDLGGRAAAPHERSAIAAMYAGVALTVVAIVVLYVDHATGNVLADHIRAGYPTYSQARIDTAVTAYLVYLSVVGALGIALLALDDPGRQGRQAVDPRRSDGDVRPRDSHRPVRSAGQGHVR